ncbi:MAG: HpcH/HpaI aldolase/citrate lyase family protein [Bacteroidetes bacterium]|nr:HpcH/HpaI aldolase/citrate lyase family protein [Bacteroidota bacterium]MBU1115464.1 HpcH/HpaI aldolase/citrate lyase family protein [Bacteroidota bacterium]MBU1800091.1 HpcH/HpaI aldolase/citrate lyase family protein [Bacteroidota bacterium]
MEKSIAGQKGDKVRSDCYIEITSKRLGGIKLDIKSKVEVMYGESIKTTILEMCDFFELKHAEILVEDYGALPSTLMARFELAVKRLNPKIEKEFLPTFNKKNKYKTSKDKLRRSRLYLPGNEPKFYPNAGLHKPDGIILDLEDSVAPTEKDAAQLIVRNSLRAIDFYGSERMVRINQFPQGLDDLKYIVPHNVHVILIPKVETAEQIIQVEEKVNELKLASKIKDDIFFMPIIESALGVINAYSIATASKYNCALAIGLEDYTADIGTQRTNEGKESFYARASLVNAAKAAGIQAIDTVFSDVNDMEGLRDSVIEAKGLGFEGKGCIHPRQIQVVHDAFAPTQIEIEKAQKIVIAFEEAKAKGIGVVSIGSKMIDAPVVKRAHNTIKLAKLNGLI